MIKTTQSKPVVNVVEVAKELVYQLDIHAGAASQSGKLGDRLQAENAGRYCMLNTIARQIVDYLNPNGVEDVEHAKHAAYVILNTLKRTPDAKRNQVYDSICPLVMTLIDNI